MSFTHILECSLKCSKVRKPTIFLNFLIKVRIVQSPFRLWTLRIKRKCCSPPKLQCHSPCVSLVTHHLELFFPHSPTNPHPLDPLANVNCHLLNLIGTQPRLWSCPTSWRERASVCFCLQLCRQRPHLSNKHFLLRSFNEVNKEATSCELWLVFFLFNSIK